MGELAGPGGVVYSEQAMSRLQRALTNFRLENPMQVKDVMSKEVVSVSPKTTIAEAIEAMSRLRVSGLPVIDEVGSLVGIVGEGDFMRRAELATDRRRAWPNALFKLGRAAGAYGRAQARRVEEVMTTNVVTVDETASLAEAVAVMEKRRVKRLPVMREGQIVGILTPADLVRALAILLREPCEQPFATDADILQQIRAGMVSQTLAPASSVEVTVKDGVVNLRGSLTDERERLALHALVQNIEGVREVHDKVALVEPYSGIPIG
jgi:CBS domain-containing protein